MDIKKTLLTAFAFHLCVISLIAQRIDNFPYSRYGIGQEIDLNNIANRGFAGLGSANIDYYNFNLINPASLPFLAATSFDIGVSAKNSTLKEGKNSNNFWSGNLDYMALAFPLSNPINEAYEGIVKNHKWAMGLSVNRRSNIGYNIQSRDSLPIFGKINRNYTGQGGTYQFGVSLGYKYKGLAIGSTLNYFWGSTKFTESVEYLDVTLPFNNEFNNSYFMKGFGLNTGIMYEHTLNKGDMKKNRAILPKNLIVGARISTPTPVKTFTNVTALSIQSITATSNIVDTISNKTDIPGKGVIPLEFGFGAFYSSQDKFGIGFDFRQVQWSDYFNDGNYNNINTLKDSYSVSFGGFYRPDYKSYNNFFKRVQYRFGTYYRQEPELINSVRNTSMGITAGMNMPFIFQRKISHVNISGDLGQSGRGTVIKETYVRLGLGFNFNDDEWFLKRKYN